MFTTGLLTAMLATALSLPLTLADSCSAVGALTTNSAGFGEGGTTYTSGNSITLYKGSTVIGGYTVCDTCSPVCSDQIAIDSSLPLVFLWGASCGVNTFSLVSSRSLGRYVQIADSLPTVNAMARMDPRLTSMVINHRVLTTSMDSARARRRSARSNSPARMDAV